MKSKARSTALASTVKIDESSGIRYHITSFLKRVGPLAAWAFGCYSVLITLSPIKNVIKAVKVVLEEFKLAK